MPCSLCLGWWVRTESWRSWSLCSRVCCWRCTSQGGGKHEPRELEFRPVRVFLLLQLSYLFFFCQIPLEAAYLHILRKGKNNRPHLGKPFLKTANSFWNEKMSPYWGVGWGWERGRKKRERGRINFSNVPVKGLYSLTSSFWREERCSVELP